MFMGIIGLLDDEDTDRCPRGNGKTCTLTYYLYRYYQKGYTVWTNYYTTFSSEVIGFQEMINRLKKMKMENEILKAEGKPVKKYKIVLGVTELQEIINSVGSTNAQVLFVDSFTSQIRKLDVDCLYDTQILKHLHKRVRRHTENIRLPVKIHTNGIECNFDRCAKKHKILIYSIKPSRKYPIKCINAWVVGKLYVSDDYIIDKIELDEPVKKSKKGVVETDGIKP